MALSQPDSASKDDSTEFLPSVTLRQRRILLRQSICQMERYSHLCRLLLPHRQAFRIQPLLRTPEQHRKKPQSAVQPVRTDAQYFLPGEVRWNVGNSHSQLGSEETQQEEPC